MKLNMTIIICFLLSLNAKSQSIEKVLAKNALEVVTNLDTSNTILIDGRSFEMFTEKHIEGAINIDAFSDHATSDLKDYLEIEKIIVYCTNFKRAKLIIKKLEELNYKGKIIFISDGINAWISSGYKTVSN